jgi:hypothetical protein
VIGAVLVASAGVGGWWWWKNQQRQNQKSAAPAVAVVTPTQPVTPPPAAQPAAPSTPPAATTPQTPAPADTTPAPSDTKPVRKRKPKETDKSANVPAPIPAPPPPVAVTPPAVTTTAPVAPPPKPTPRVPVIQTTPVSVSDALPFVIILEQDVAADAPEGMGLSFTVSEGLKIGDKTIIAKGATVTGSVTGESNKKGFLGIKGGHKLTFRLMQAEAVDGKKLAVRAMAGRGEDGVTIRTFETNKGARPKGYAAVQGTVYIAYIDGDQTVAVRK